MTDPYSKLLKVLNGEKISPPPVWLMRQAGRYLPEYRELRQRCPNFLKFCFTSDLVIEATLQPLRRYDMDAAILFSDILVVPYVLGQEVEFCEGKGPRLSPLHAKKDILKLNPNSLPEILSPVLDSIRSIRKILPPEKALIGFAGAPWTIFAYMIEGETSRTFSQAVQFFYRYPDEARILMDIISDATERYLSAQIEAGVQVIQLFDSWAGIVPYPLLEEVIYAPMRRLLRFLKRKFPHIPVICFPKGIGEKLSFYLKATGATALSLDPHVDLSIILPQISRTTVLQGGLDPQALVTGGKILEQEIRRLKKSLAEYPYIFNLGHGVVPETPPEHVMELVHILRA